MEKMVFLKSRKSQTLHGVTYQGYDSICLADGELVCPACHLTGATQSLRSLYVQYSFLPGKDRANMYAKCNECEHTYAFTMIEEQEIIATGEVQ